jgi:ferritin-like metal-binding protein YciE
MSQANPENLRDLLIVKIKVLFDTEQQLVKALPKMAEAATTEELKTAFMDHLEETKGHVTRLEKIFEMLEVAPNTETSDSVRGLVSDTEWCIENIVAGPVLDAALIASAQYAEHQEMAGYGSAAEWAKVLDLTEIKDTLGETLDEEKAADEKLNVLATTKVNEAAIGMRDSEEESKGFLGNLQTGNI